MKVTLTGVGFTGATAVSFNGTATFALQGDTEISATVPEGATSGPVSVTAPQARPPAPQTLPS